MRKLALILNIVLLVTVAVLLSDYGRLPQGIELFVLLVVVGSPVTSILTILTQSTNSKSLLALTLQRRGLEEEARIAALEEARRSAVNSERKRDATT